MISAQTETIQEVLHLLRDQSYSMRDPRSIAEQVDGLISSAEETERGVKDLEEILSDDDESALLGTFGDDIEAELQRGRAAERDAVPDQALPPRLGWRTPRARRLHPRRGRRSRTEQDPGGGSHTDRDLPHRTSVARILSPPPRMPPDHAARIARLAPERGSAPTRSSRRSARAAWARSTGRGTRGSAARSRSRCCRRLRGRAVQRASSARRRRSRLSTRTSARSTTSGGEGETDYLVMELLEGETLADRLGKGPLPLEQVLRFGIQIADALDEAHRHGHRAPRPEARQRDAHEVGREAARLRPGQAADGGRRVQSRASRSLATEAQVSQPLTERGHDRSARSSTWRPSSSRAARPTRAPTSSRFGAVLYEMATGKKAFTGKSQASLIALDHVRDEPPPISERAPMIPPALDRVVPRLPRQGSRRPLADGARRQARAPVDRRGRLAGRRARARRGPAPEPREARLGRRGARGARGRDRFAFGLGCAARRQPRRSSASRSRPRRA